LNKAALQEASAAAGFDIPAGHESFATQKCPQCDSADWMPLGTPGYITRSLWAVFFGFIGALAANSSGKNRAETPAFICKCRSCRNKWEARPKEVPLEARLETPCRISMTRPGSFVGAAVAQFIYLNGKRVGILKNGGTIEFETAEPYNILFATDGSGTAFQNTRYFEAPSGGELNFNFNRKFV
jgi:hypothetical protein